MGIFKLLLSGLLGFVVPLEVTGKRYLKQWVMQWGQRDPATIPEAVWDELVRDCLATSRTFYEANGRREQLRTIFVQQLQGEGSLLVQLLHGDKSAEVSNAYRVLKRHGVLK